MKLNADKRKRLPAKDFAGPDRSWPINDKTHARVAKAYASKEYNEGKLSEDMKEKIDSKADKKLGKKRPMGLLNMKMS